MFLIELKNVNKVYEDGFQALKDINLVLEQGKINVLIGPSGCGKSTTMKLLNRLEDFTDGEILIDGEDIRTLDPIELRRNMGYVIQNIGLFPHMNIYDNVATVPKLLKWDKKRIQARVHELLNMVNLDPEVYSKRYPSNLSGGQQQRIGVIRALAAEPSTILMDEPFSALDPISREQLQDELVNLQKEIQKTIVFVTHDMDEALKIADQIILMNDGHIVQQGSPHELLENPLNDFVREFIGVQRLENSKTLPPLNKFIRREYIEILDTSTVKFAIETMVSKNISHVPVVDKERKYLGVVSLYNAIGKEDEKLKNLIDNSVQVVMNTTEIDEVVKNINKSKSPIIPVVSKDNELFGLIDQNLLFRALQQIYENKSGVA